MILLLQNGEINNDITTSEWGNKQWENQSHKMLNVIVKLCQIQEINLMYKVFLYKLSLITISLYIMYTMSLVKY